VSPIKTPLNDLKSSLREISGTSEVSPPQEPRPCSKVKNEGIGQGHEGREEPFAHEGRKKSGQHEGGGFDFTGQKVTGSRQKREGKTPQKGWGTDRIQTGGLGEDFQRGKNFQVELSRRHAFREGVREEKGVKKGDGRSKPWKRRDGTGGPKKTQKKRWGRG